MAKPKPPSEGADSGAGSAAMERFKSLTKGLLGVPLAKVKEADKEKAARVTPRGPLSPSS